jgi:hypothetical protein
VASGDEVAEAAARAATERYERETRERVERIAEIDRRSAAAEARLAEQVAISTSASRDITALHERAISILQAPHPSSPPSTGGGWNVETLKQHFDALRSADERFYNERDRRYTEVSVEREKALKIKDEADKAALGLAREIQQYKDEKANELREQIGSERGLYPSKSELLVAVREVRTELMGMLSNAKADTRWTIERVLPIVVAIAVVAFGYFTK